jgi:ATP-dependent exoDNAse (exonuclease V) beta subunit
MLNQFYANIPYNQLTESSYQGHLHMLLRLVGGNIVTEVHTSKGRIDMVINFDNRIYVIEFKLNKGGALKQIIDKQYAKKYEKSRKLITLIGIEICLNNEDNFF